MSVTPLGKRRGWLKNGNRPGDFSAAPRCGARNRRHLPCRAPAMRGRKRCRMHGGKSTGPRTAEGLERIRQAHLTHGLRTQAAKTERDRARQARKNARALMAAMNRLLR